MGDVVKVMFGKGVATPLSNDLLAEMIEQASREDKKPNNVILTEQLNIFLLDAGIDKAKPLGFMMGYINGEDVESVKFTGDAYNDVFNEYLSRLMGGDMELQLFAVQLDKYRISH